jgi:hypothetical protein
MGKKQSITKTPVTAPELRRHMIMAFEEITKRLARFQMSLTDPSQVQEMMHYEPPLKQQAALLMSQWGAEQGGGTTYNFNLTGVKHPGPSKDRYNTDYFFAATFEVFDKATAQGYIARGGGLVEVLEDNGVTMKLRFKPDHPACAFRAFPTLREGCLFHLKNLRDNYSEAWAVVIQFLDEHNLASLGAFVDRLAAKRYFTASKKDYLAAITRYYKEYVNAGDPVWNEAVQFAEARRA